MAHIVELNEEQQTTKQNVLLCVDLKQSLPRLRVLQLEKDIEKKVEFSLDLSQSVEVSAKGTHIFILKLRKTCYMLLSEQIISLTDSNRLQAFVLGYYRTPV